MSECSILHAKDLYLGLEFVFRVRNPTSKFLEQSTLYCCSLLYMTQQLYATHNDPTLFRILNQYIFHKTVTSPSIVA